MSKIEFVRRYSTPEETLIVIVRTLNHIISNLNTGSGYVIADAYDIPLADSGGYFSIDNVESALQYLAATSIYGTLKVTTKTGTATLTTNEFGVIICNSASDMTLNLPTATGVTGKPFYITNTNTGTVTIDPNGSQTIQGDAAFDLYQDEMLNIISDGSNWKVI